jgi:hypothetical protein
VPSPSVTAVVPSTRRPTMFRNAKVSQWLGSWCLAVRARPAGVERQHHMVTHGDAMRRGADRLHNPGFLVAGDDRQRPEGTRGNVGMADSGADNLHQHLVGAGIAGRPHR